MTITLDELTQCEESLQTEIVERECLLAAIRVLRGHATKGQRLASFELGALASALLRSPQKSLLIESSAVTDLPAPAALPPPPPMRRYVHPDLERQQCMHGSTTFAVRWAIERMTGDFSVVEIAALLKREGYWVENPQISVVLTRLKARREIEEIQSSCGPKPALFRRPDWALPLDAINGCGVEVESSPAAAVA